MNLLDTDIDLPRRLRGLIGFSLQQAPGVLVFLQSSNSVNTGPQPHRKFLRSKPRDALVILSRKGDRESSRFYQREIIMATQSNDIAGAVYERNRTLFVDISTQEFRYEQIPGNEQNPYPGVLPHLGWGDPRRLAMPLSISARDASDSWKSNCFDRINAVAQLQTFHLNAI